MYKITQRIFVFVDGRTINGEIIDIINSNNNNLYKVKFLDGSEILVDETKILNS